MMYLIDNYGLEFMNETQIEDILSRNFGEVTLELFHTKDGITYKGYEFQTSEEFESILKKLKVWQNS